MARILTSGVKVIESINGHDPAKVPSHWASMAVKRLETVRETVPKLEQREDDPIDSILEKEFNLKW